MLEFHEAGEQNVNLDTITINSVTNAWANSRDPSAGKRAEAIIDRMLEFHEASDPNVNPDTITFNSVTIAWANSRDPSAGRRAEAILGQQS
jgi:hypothetical protein